MRKSLASYLPDNRDRKQKKIILVAISVVIGTVILVAIAVVAISMMSKSPAATPTPVSPTPAATATPTPAPTPVPTTTPAPSSGQVYSYDGPFIMRAYMNGGDGKCVISFMVPSVGPSVNMNNTTMSIVCDGRTYDNVWSIKPIDWDPGSDGDAMLEPDENIATYIDTVSLGIPQGKPITVKVYKNAVLMQEISVAPTY